MNNRKNILISCFIFLILTVFVDLIAPSEQTLKEFIRLIYIHAAITWASLLLYTLSGIYGIIYLVSRKESFVDWSVALEKTAILFWAVNTLLGVISMRLVWGDFIWNEPRLSFSIIVLLVSAAAYFLSVMVDRSFVVSILNIVVVFLIWFLLFKTGRVFHPANPILGSSDINIKLYSGIITIFLLLTGVQMTRLVRKNQKSNFSIT